MSAHTSSVPVTMKECKRTTDETIPSTECIVWIDGDCFLGESAIGFLRRCVYCMGGLEFLLNKKSKHFEISVPFVKSFRNFISERNKLILKIS